MRKNQLTLLTKKKFLPLFITQFLGAFNDNFFKTTLVVLITFIVGSQDGVSTDILVTMTGALLIIPMFLFSATAGILADSYDKATLIKLLKAIEVLLMALAGIGFLVQNIYFMMVVLFLMGTQSTFFGPLKYSILPVHLEDNELIGGNALIDVGTFLSILLGNVIGVFIISLHDPYILTTIIMLLVACVGFVSALSIPKAPAVTKNLKASYNFIKDTIDIIQHTRKSRDIFLSILAVSWFWLVGFTFLTQFPNLTKEFLSGDQDVYILFLSVFSIGICAGGLLCNWLTSGRIEATFVPLAALIVSLFTFDLVYSVKAYGIVGAEDLLGPHAFLSHLNHWRIIFDLVMISVAAGIFVVPLYAIMQHESDPKRTARTIAANNVMNAFFMSAGALVTVLLFAAGFDILKILLLLGILNLIVMFAICEIIPDRFIKSMLRIILKMMYQVEVKGLDNFDKAGNRMIICPNHTSFIDGLLLGAFLPGKLTFAMNEEYTQKWWARAIRWVVDIYGLDPLNPMAIKSLIKIVKEDKICVIFPEGRITVTGALMKIYEGPGMISINADAPILPVRIEGAQFTPFSKLKGKIRLQWFPKIKITIMPATTCELPEGLSARHKRQLVGEKLHKIMTDMMFESAEIDRSLFQVLIDAQNIYGDKTQIIEDINRAPLTYKKLILASYVIGRRIASFTKPKESVGVMLPNSVGCVVTFFSLFSINRCCAMINFTAGATNVLSACEAVQIKTLLTSKQFIDAAKLHDMIVRLEQEKIKIVYMEDLKSSIHIGHKLLGMLTYHLPCIFWRHKNVDTNDPAIALFTSGSEGAPKAVLLSNNNLIANINQLKSCVDFNSSDLVLNVLPIFHSFGLTGGTLLPILSGLKVFMYPTPLHFRIIPELCYDIGATIFFGTNTFLASYAKYANPYDFYSVRYVFCGAEKLQTENRNLWSEKFGVRLFEGYGATEAAPVISTNTPMHNKVGTVGRFLPKVEYKLEPVPGIEEGSRLFVKGPNVMLGYMLVSNPGKLIPPCDGWYDTGDIVAIDDEGYITIKGRAKRFAKIAGEMVSLTAVESMIETLWPGYVHAILAVHDPKKGEQLILATTKEEADRAEIAKFAKEHQYTELMIPRTIKTFQKIPLLGTGKVDYPTLAGLVGS